MKILFVSAYDAPRGQSARNYLFAKGLVELGHDVTFMTNGFNHFTRKDCLNKREWSRVEMIDGIRTIWLKTIPYKSNGIDRILNMLSNSIMCLIHYTKSPVKPDIVIGPSVPPFTALSAYLIAKKSDAKFIFEIRDPWPEILILMGNLKQKSILSYIFRALSGFLYRKCDLIITTLNNVDSILDRASVKHEKAVHLLNPIELTEENYNSLKNEQLNPLTVSYVGGFGYGQDIKTMLEATKYIKNEKIRFKFVGAPQDKISTLIKEYGSDTVEILPVVSKSEVPFILKNSSILMSAHRNDGAFKFGINSNKLHDYLAAGKPIVFSAYAPGNPVELSGAGFVVEPENPKKLAEAIIKISKLSESERDDLGRKGFDYAKDNLDVKKLSLKLEKIFESMINRGNANA